MAVMVFSLPQILPRIADPQRRFLRYLNFLLALMARRQREVRVFSLPFELTLDLSTRCQLSCPYCSVGNRTIRRPAGRMPMELHEQIMEDLGQTAFLIWYFSTGEPLLNKDAAPMFRQAADREIFSIISTNLSFALSPKQMDALLVSGLGVICVSLDGTTPETYGRYRVGGDFLQVVDNMKRLVARKKELGLEFPLIEWRFLVFDHNMDQVARAGQMAREIGVDILEFFPGTAPRDAKKGEVRACPADFPIPGPTGPALERARQRRDTYFRKFGRIPSPAEHPVPQALLERKCDWLYFGCAVFPNASVGPCCASNHEADDFGRLDRSGFLPLWNNDPYQKARASFFSDPSQDLVCLRCPAPMSKDYQFRMTIRALLHNAPDWVIHVLCKAPDLFFYDIDALLSPLEARIITGPPKGLDRDVSEAVSRLEKWKAANPALEKKARSILDLLAAD